MRKLILGLFLMLAAVAPAFSQAQTSQGQGQVQIIGNSNLAYVNSNNALQVELHNGSSTVSLTGTSLNVNVTNGSSGGTSIADEGTFTEGTTSGTPANCYYKTSPTALTTGQTGTLNCTAARALFIDAHSWAGTALGAPSNYGTSPGAVEVPGFNAYVTNIPAVTFSGSQTVGLVAGTALVGKTAPLTACGTTNYSAAWQALTTSATAITATTTCVNAISACNTSSSTAYTFTVTDDQGTPINVIDATSIPPSSCYTWPFYYQEFTSGIKWSASNTAITGAIQGIQ